MDIQTNATKLAKKLTDQQEKMKEVFDKTDADEAMGKKVKEIAQKWKDSDQSGSYQDFVKKELEGTDVDEKMKKEIKKIHAMQKEALVLNDTLMAGVTFRDLIDTVYSNERTRDEAAVKKIFKELTKANLRDAEYELRQNMKAILKELKD